MFRYLLLVSILLSFACKSGDAGLQLSETIKQAPAAKIANHKLRELLNTYGVPIIDQIYSANIWCHVPENAPRCALLYIVRDENDIHARANKEVENQKDLLKLIELLSEFGIQLEQGPFFVDVRCREISSQWDCRLSKIPEGNLKTPELSIKSISCWVTGQASSREVITVGPYQAEYRIELITTTGDRRIDRVKLSQMSGRGAGRALRVTNREIGDLRPGIDDDRIYDLHIYIDNWRKDPPIFAAGHANSVKHLNYENLNCRVEGFSGF